MKKDVLVNKNNPINPLYYRPSDLITLDENENNFHNYADPLLKPQVSLKIYRRFSKLQRKFHKKFEGSFLIVDSGFRSYEYQQKVYQKNNCNDNLCAKPGYSEHQTGLAIDVAFVENGKYTDEFLENDPRVLWLIENSWKSGFILRYPKEKKLITGYDYEWWHYRYVGKSLAKKLYKHKWVLEEYYKN